MGRVTKEAILGVLEGAEEVGTKAVTSVSTALLTSIKEAKEIIKKPFK